MKSLLVTSICAALVVSAHAMAEPQDNSPLCESLYTDALTKLSSTLVTAEDVLVYYQRSNEALVEGNIKNARGNSAYAEHFVHTLVEDAVFTSQSLFNFNEWCGMRDGVPYQIREQVAGYVQSN